jgi:hypothetical protein
MRGVSVTDRVISVIGYYTCGIFGLIWIIFANVTKRRITPFLTFNLYQAIFVSVALAILSILYSIAINILAAIPVIGRLAESFEIFFNQTPIYANFTLSGFLTTVLLTYLAVLSALGKRPFLPMISNMIDTNFGG